MDDLVWQDKNDDSASSDERSKSGKKRKLKKEKRSKDHREKKLDSRYRNSKNDLAVEVVQPISSEPQPSVVSVSKPLFPSFSATQPVNQPVVETLPSSGAARDAWMGSDESSFLFPSVSRQDLRKPSQDKRNDIRAAQAAETEKIYKSRELNPFLREGTTSDKDDADRSDPVPSTVAVGDGGLSWLRKSYSRLSEQAKDQNRSIEDVAADRWGSLGHLENLIREAEKREEASASKDKPSRVRDDRYSRGMSGSKRGSSSREDSYESSRRDRDGSRERYNRERHLSTRKYVPRSIVSTTIDKPTFVKPGEAIADSWKTSKRKNATRIFPSAAPFSRENDDSRTRTNIDDKTLATEREENSFSKQEVVPEVTLSEAELNQLNARILRSELMGDAETVAQLKAKIAAAKSSSRDNSSKPISSNSSREAVILQRSHVKGFSYPVASSSKSSSHGKKPKVATHDKDGERERYFADDDKYSLKDLVSMERMQSAEEQNAMFARLAGKSTEKTDDEYGVDDAFMKKALNKESLDQMSLADRDKAIMEHRQISSALSSCLYCLEGGKIAKNAIIAVGKKSQLILPPYASLTEGHCLICPIPHVAASTSLDEDVWEEMQSFRRALTNMFQEQDMDCVFMETVMNLKSHPHTMLECVPLDKDSGSTAPMYFKKAILESESEWANNVKLVDLQKKNIRQAIPKNFPYFAVDFGMQGGYAHIIEDERKFPSYFGREIIGGMIDASPNLWLKNKTANFNEQMKAVIKFTEMWRPFDFTYID